MVRIDKTNQKYYRLTAVKPIGKNKKRETIWRFKCACGGEKICSWGYAKSCGCLAVENSLRNIRGVRRTLPAGEASFKAAYAEYVLSAKRRNLVWRITPEDFRALTSMICFYCSRPPAQYQTNLYRGKNRFNGDYVYNGLDRLYSNQPYGLENVVPCCKTCNYMKRSMTPAQFLTHLQKIYNHMKLV